MLSRRAVFIDRDGTLTEEVGYVNHPKRLKLLPRSAAAVRRLNEARVPAVVVTKQAGIARGYFSGEVLHPTEGTPPWRLDCECRKPKPGLLLRAAAERGLDPAASAMIGDKASDLEVAPHVGAHPALVLTGYGMGEWEYRRAAFRVAPDHVADDLLDAVEWILERAQAR